MIRRQNGLVQLRDHMRWEWVLGEGGADGNAGLCGCDARRASPATDAKEAS